MAKGVEQLKSQMKPAGQGECTFGNGLFATDIPVWYENSGKVNPVWLSIERKECTQTMIKKIVNHFKETAVHVSTYGGVRGQTGSSSLFSYSIFVNL